MQGVDVGKLRADTQEIQKCLDNAVELAGNDATRAFAAVDEAKKRLQEVHAVLYYEHIVTIRRA